MTVKDDSELTGRVSDHPGRQMIDYDFPLSRGLMIWLRLPLDLSKDEAARLNQFISMLPFNRASDDDFAS